jgi:uncharacterized protein
LKAFIQRLPFWVEIAIVMVFAFGLFAIISLEAFLAPEQAADIPINNQGLTALIAVEVVVFAALAIFLRLRGWTVRAIGLTPGIRQTITGLGLAAIALAVFAVLDSLTSGTPAAGTPAAGTNAPLVASELSLTLVVLLCLVNPIYEEVLVCGYLVSALRERHAASIAVAASSILRMTYHLYQGPAAAFLIGLLGLGFALYYVRTGRLWPVIVAHSALDFVGLVPSVGSG